MKSPKAFDFAMIQVDEFSSSPKYQQLINGILTGISNGKIVKGDSLPSINDLSNELDISRDTAEKAYRHLKAMNVLHSVPGKGYFIEKADFRQTLNICLLFNKLSEHKKIIYDAFMDAIGEHVAIDFYIYNNDFALFKKLLLNKKGYSHYVIIPHFMEGGDHAHEIINANIAPEKLLLLDKQLPGVKGEYAAVYEKFGDDIYDALEKALKPLEKYSTIKLIFPRESYYPKEIQRGVSRFCQDYAFTYKLVHKIAEEPIEKGDVFINVKEDDLVMLIERLLAQEMKIGAEVGVISYNETPLKKIILDGITTVSTDFRAMGNSAAKMILDNERRHLEIPFHLTLRASL